MVPDAVSRIFAASDDLISDHARTRGGASALPSSLSLTLDHPFGSRLGERTSGEPERTWPTLTALVTAAIVHSILQRPEGIVALLARNDSRRARDQGRGGEDVGGAVSSGAGSTAGVRAAAKVPRTHGARRRPWGAIYLAAPRYGGHVPSPGVDGAQCL